MPIPQIILEALSEALLREWVADLEAREQLQLRKLANLNPRSAGLPFTYQSLQDELERIRSGLSRVSNVLQERYPNLDK